MPLFHFAIADHVRLEDPEGTELPDAGTARIEAVRFAGAYLAEHPELVRDNKWFEVQLTDDAGNRLFTVAIQASDAKD